MTDSDRPKTGLGSTARIVEMQREPTVRVSGDPPAPTDGNLALEGSDPDKPDRLVGRIVAGRYEVLRVLGRGGMGIVYEGRHVTVGRSVAIKVLRNDLARSTEAVMRFHREAKAAAAIGSEHIVEVFDFGYSDDGDAYIAMEMLEGEDLGRIVRREGPMAEPRALEIVKQISRALEAAHAKGIIHRDLKSENVFVVRRDGGDFVKLLDFGISKVSEGDEGRGPMTSEGVVMGTPHYMAPEQAMSDVEADHRLDVYALGCLMYEMLVGRVPFTGKNPVEVVFKHVHEAPVPPRALRADLSAKAERVVLKALAKKREDRFENAAALITALNAPDADDTAPATTQPTRVSAVAGVANEPDTRSRMLLGVVAVLLVGVVGGVVAWRSQSTGHVDQPMTRAVPTASVDSGSATVPVAVVDAGRPASPIEVRDTALAISVVPRSAEIEIDGHAAGTGESQERFANGSTHHVVVSAAGFATVERDVVLDGPQAVTVVMTALPTAGVVRAVRDAGRVVRVESPAGAGAGDAGAGTGQGTGGRVGDPGADGLKGSPYGGGAL